MALECYIIRAIIWRERKLLKNNVTKCLIETLVPVFCVLILSIARGSADGYTTVRENPNVTLFKVETENMFTSRMQNRECLLVYAPKNGVTSKFIPSALDKLPKADFIGVESNLALNTFLKQRNYMMNPDMINSSIWGIELEGIGVKSDNKGARYKYKLITSDYEGLSRKHYLKCIQEPGFNISSEINDSSVLTEIIYYYINLGFIRKFVDHGKVIDTDKMVVDFQRFPYPPHDVDPFRTTFFQVYMQYAIIGMSLVLIFPLMKLIRDKDTAAEELIEIMGVPRCLILMTRFLRTVIIYLFTCFLMTTLLKMNFSNVAVFHQSSFSVIYLLLLIYFSASILFVFALAILLRNSKVSIVVYLVLLILPNFSEDTSIYLKMWSALNPSAALYHAFLTMNQHEIRDQQLNVLNSFAYKVPMHIHYPPVGYWFLVLLFDSVLFILLEQYMTHYHPGKFGAPYPWFSILINKLKSFREIYNKESDSLHFIESKPFGFAPGVRFRNVTLFSRKLCGFERPLLDRVSLEFYVGQVSVLFGENYLAKYSFLELINGMKLPDSGFVIVNQYNTKQKVSEVRKLVGWCPHHEMYINDITLLNTIIFFCMLKGFNTTLATRKAEDLMASVNLHVSSKIYYQDLEILARKLFCFTIMDIDNCKVLLFDDPTVDLDEDGQKIIWDKILRLRKGNTVIVTTQNFNEADFLAERLAVIINGQLKCYGKPLFVKMSYNTGYELILVKKSDFKEEAVHELVKRCFPHAVLKNNYEKHVSYEVPKLGEQYFQEVFAILEESKEMYGIDEILMESTNLNHMYIDHMLKPNEEIPLRNMSFTSVTNMLKQRVLESKVIHPLSLMQQLCVLCLSGILIRFRRWRKILFQIMLLLLFTTAACLIAIFVPPNKENAIRIPESLYYLKNSIVLYKCIDSSAETQLKSAITESGGIPTASLDIYKDLLTAGENDIGEYRDKYIYALEWDEGNLSLFYTTLSRQGVLMAIHVSTNFLLKLNVGPKSSLKTIFVPFPNRYVQLKSYFQNNSIVVCAYQFLIPFGFLIYLLSFCELPSQDRISGFKHQQVLAGVRAPIYWLSFYLLDIVPFIIISSIVVLEVYLFGVQQAEILFSSECRSGALLYGPASVGYFFTMLFLFGTVMLLLVYLISFYVADMSKLHFIGAIMSIFCSALPLLLTEKEDGGIMKFINVLHYVSILNPLYIFNWILLNLQHQVNWRLNCQEFKNIINCSKHYSDVMDCCDTGCLHNGCFFWMHFQIKDINLLFWIIFLGVNGIIYLILLVFHEVEIKYGAVSSVAERNQLNCNVHPDVPSGMEVTSRDTGSSSTVPRFIFLVQDITKMFWSHPAVQAISFVGRAGNIVAISGNNKSGKTTLMKIISGVIKPTFGDVYVQYNSLQNNRRKYLSSIGYCPQNVALNPYLTCKETFDLFVKLRGCKSIRISREVNFWIVIFGLLPVQNVLIKNISALNKRKVCLGLAFIGNPSVIILDEPMQNLDCNSRYILYNLLLSIRDTGQVVVLGINSHDVNLLKPLECRVCIITGGQIKCTGSQNNLRVRYGCAKRLQFKLTETCEDDINNAILDLNQDVISVFIAELLTQTEVTLCYFLKEPLLPLSKLFTKLERLKQRHKIILEYIIHDVPLHEMFMQHSKHQVGTANRKLQLRKRNKYLSCNSLEQSQRVILAAKNPYRSKSARSSSIKKYLSKSLNSSGSDS